MKIKKMLYILLFFYWTLADIQILPSQPTSILKSESRFAAPKNTVPHENASTVQPYMQLEDSQHSKKIQWPDTIENPHQPLEETIWHKTPFYDKDPKQPQGPIAHCCCCS